MIDTNGYYLAPPPLVMQTAITPTTLGNLTLPYNYGSATPIKCVYYMYFAEVNQSSTATSREFTVSIPGPYAETPYTFDIYNTTGGINKPIVYWSSNFSETDTSEVVMNPLSGSSEPPLVNGAELYSQYPALTPPTYSPDGQSCTTNWNLHQIFIDMHAEEWMIGLQSCDFVHSYKKFITSASPEYDIDVN